MANEEFEKFLQSWAEGKEEFNIFTSGSTGRPKKIRLKKSQLIYSSNVTAKELGLNKNSKIFCCIDPMKIGGIMMWVRAAVLNCELLTVQPSSDPMTNLADDHVFNFISLVPFQLYQILKNHESTSKLNRFDTVLLGGASLSEKVIDELVSMDPTFYQSYGMTETCSHVGLKKIEEIGYRTIGDIEISLDDNKCLILKGSVTNFEEINSNDIVEFLESGRFKWKGRFDNIINSGGVKIVPEEVERKIIESNNIPGPSGILIVGVKDDELGEKVVLILKGENVGIDLSQLTKYELPKAIYSLKNFVFTSNGKIDRKKTVDLLSLHS